MSKVTISIPVRYPDINMKEQDKFEYIKSLVNGAFEGAIESGYCGQCDDSVDVSTKYLNSNKDEPISSKSSLVYCKTYDGFRKANAKKCRNYKK